MKAKKFKKKYPGSYTAEEAAGMFWTELYTNVFNSIGRGNPKEAIMWATKMVAVVPPSSVANSLLALAKVTAGQFTEAIQIAGEALTLWKYNFLAYFVIGEATLMLGNLEEAESNFLLAIHRAHVLDTYFREDDHLNALLGHPEEAIFDPSRVLSDLDLSTITIPYITEFTAQAPVELVKVVEAANGVTQEEAGKLAITKIMAMFIKELTEAIDRTPHEAMLYLGRAVMYKKNNQNDEFLDDINKYKQFFPSMEIDVDVTLKLIETPMDWDVSDWGTSAKNGQ